MTAPDPTLVAAPVMVRMATPAPVPGPVPAPVPGDVVAEPPAAPAAPRRAGWLPLGLSLAACLASCLALAVSLGREPTPLPPILVSMPSDVPASLIGVELLLPHLPRSQPFQRPFAVATLLAAGDAEVLGLLATLRDAAREGAPTQRQLLESFSAAADAAVLVEMGFAADAGWLARRAATAMRIGAAFGSNGTPVLAAMDAIGPALAQGALAEADDILQGFGAALPPALAAWRDMLDRRMAADAAAQRLAALSRDRAEAVTPLRTAAR